MNNQNAGEKANLPLFAVGDTVSVRVKIQEGDKERVQVFSGVVIARRGPASHESFTVRHVSYGVGVERIFPVHSPYIVGIEVQSRGRTRRAKLYYLRRLKGKKSRLRERALELHKEGGAQGQIEASASAQQAGTLPEKSNDAEQPAQR